MFRSIEGQQSNRLILEGNSLVFIFPKPDARLKWTTANYFGKHLNCLYKINYLIIIIIMNNFRYFGYTNMCLWYMQKGLRLYKGTPNCSGVAAVSRYYNELLKNYAKCQLHGNNLQKFKEGIVFNLLREKYLKWSHRLNHEERE